jgi:hypothetical protein
MKLATGIPDVQRDAACTGSFPHYHAAAGIGAERLIGASGDGR